jgi:hypothetical protein
MAVSSDAKIWIKTEQDFVGFAFIYDMAFGNGQFIAVGNTAADSAFMYTSNDGLTWSEKNLVFILKGMIL